MKAAIYDKFGGPIRVQNNVPIPKVSFDGILLKVQATGICRSDYSGWKGYDSDIVKHGLPFCPGHELSGIVIKIGLQTKNFNIGDRVVVPFILSCGLCTQCTNNRATICCYQKQPGFTQWGSFAEYINIPRADRNVQLLPPDISFIQAAALGCRFTTAYRAIIQQGNLHQIILNNNNNNHKSSKTSVSIFGCGGLGLSCIMITKAAAEAVSNNNNSNNSINIIAVDVSTKALQKAKELGATHIIQVTKDIMSTPQDVAKQVVVCCVDDDDDDDADDGIDLTLDTAGFAITSEAAVYSTKSGGRMVQVGLPHDRIPQIPMDLIAGKEIEILGSHGFDSQDLPSLLDMITTNSDSNSSNNKMDPCQLIEKEVTLEEGCTILENMDQHSPLGIVMITKFNNDDNDNDNDSDDSGEKQQQQNNNNNNNKSSSLMKSRL